MTKEPLTLNKGVGNLHEVINFYIGGKEDGG
jgi:hypothetical protein